MFGIGFAGRTGRGKAGWHFGGFGFWLPLFRFFLTSNWTGRLDNSFRNAGKGSLESIDATIDPFSGTPFAKF
jgi:hypothetical protein